MRINYANIGILEIAMMCLVIYGLLLTLNKNKKTSITGRIVACITLLSYVLLKSSAF